MSSAAAWRIGVIGVAVVLAAVPWPSGLVERWYARTVYPSIQSILTGMSNLVSVALLDLLLLAACAAAVWELVRIVQAGSGRRRRAVSRAVFNLITAAAALYVAFWIGWGLNYQREPATDWLDYDESRLTPERARGVAEQIVAALERLKDVEPPVSDGGTAVASLPLAAAFDEAVRAIGLAGGTRIGRPKRSLLDPYLVRAGVSGLTDPFFLETIVAGNLLPVERPAVIAHEWAHLAGLARESEASFVGWLSCIHADRWSQYSGWLDLFTRVIGSLGGPDRRAVLARVPRRAMEDIRSIQERNQRDQIRFVTSVAWRTYDSYLKSNRVASGVGNYSEVARMVLGTRFDGQWRPFRR